MRPFLIFALFFVCATPATAQPATQSDKAQVLTWAKQTLPNPHSLQSTKISDRAVVRRVHVLCVSYDGKSKYGAYHGVKRYPFEIKGNKLIPLEQSILVNSGTCNQRGIIMRPFPEMTNIK